MEIDKLFGSANGRTAGMLATDTQESWTIEDAVEAVRAEIGDFRPEIMVTLGSGLGDAIGHAEIYHSIAYSSIPGLAAPHVAGHAGKLLVGEWGGRRALIFQGRIHWYEGHPWKRVTLPVSIAAQFGAGMCLFTNMSGAINPRLQPGMMVVIDDHMNFTGSNPLIGITANDPSTMFPDMQEAYSLRLRRLLDKAAAMNGQTLAHGVYVGVSGPNYETPAEVRALGLLGADIVGMSTVGEVLVARQAGLECCAISCVANMAASVNGKAIRHNDVLEAAHSVSFRMATLIDTFLRMV